VSTVGLKNSSASKKDNEWGAPAENNQINKKGANDWGNNDMDDLLDDFTGAKKNEASRNSGGAGGAYSGFGILGKNSAVNKSDSNNFPTFGGKRNSNASARGGGEDEGDLLDNILDDFEEKKGIESTKPKKDSSFGSQNN